MLGSKTEESTTASRALPDVSIIASEGGFGINTLYEGSENPTVDIVAVHGFRAHPIKNWKNGEVMWLQDLLPKDLPNARVMTYGYNSNVVEDASISSIRDFAKGLLNDLDSHRIEEEKERPIIFICHSLGGLVVKQALCIANRERIYQHLNTATYGVIFLGTPHQGSSQAQIALAVTRVVKYAYPRIKTHIIESLRENSPILEDLADEFRNLHSQFKIVSCYERVKTTYGLIVDKGSALMGFEGERQIPMEGDHSRICKFTGRDDHLYVVLLGRIQELARSAPNAVSVKFNIANTIRM